jgi:hypothetical protein
LIQKYAGPDDERADGFDEKAFEDGRRRLYAGDRSEAQFLDVMRNLKIGGILVGDIYSRDLLDANFATNAASFFQPTALRDFLKKRE